ncbi:MAG TPA: [FeFe] hydrogenase H-cluster maturation GTPase HydF [Ignavibacteriaceae bacterium]|nr:[FeFe] hydrogenase H-cluster maturation GTPase HydF [Ignavibacteriaceae bacterium]
MQTSLSKKQIVFVGRRNAGKSSLVNVFLGQDISIVSEIPGTTTDPVKKSMELLPYGPVMLIDTAGIDDFGELGQKRISRTIRAISGADFAVVVIDATKTLSTEEYELLNYLDKISIPFVIAANKIEMGINPRLLEEMQSINAIHYEISCKLGVGIDSLKRKVIRMLPSGDEPPLMGDLVSQGDIVVLVVPIDLGAPKNRLILPQIQTIREALDEDTIVVIAKDNELRRVLATLKSKPDLVITDSQAVIHVAADVPDDIMLTTFSILMARYKGDLKTFIKGLKRVNELQNGDRILIAEACSHHEQKDDIGTVKIPRWLRSHTGKNLQFDYSHGNDFPENLSQYRLIVHCSACMISRKMMQMRLNEASLMGVPIVNYGMLISYMNGAVPRALLPFGEAVYEWEKNNARVSVN